MSKSSESNLFLYFMLFFKLLEIILYNLYYQSVKDGSSPQQHASMCGSSTVTNLTVFIQFGFTVLTKQFKTGKRDLYKLFQGLS